MKYYLITDGPLLDAVKASIASVVATDNATYEFCERLGVKQVRKGFRGTPISFLFDRRVPQGFTHRDKHGASHPKRNSEYYEAWQKIPPNQDDVKVIQEITGIPLSYNYSDGEGCSGGSAIGDILFACGFLYPSTKGPYVLYVPDVQAQLAEFKTERPNAVLEDNIEAWRMNVPGIEEITKARWDLIVAQHAVEQEEKANAKEDRT